jgi:uncharacterized protein (TIGR02452 family)
MNRDGGHLMLIERDRARRLGEETVQILAARRYVAASGTEVGLGGPLQRAVEGTMTYPPGCPLPEIEPGHRRTAITVANETTFVAARRIVGRGRRALALNFASATSPGGGFLSGARAQEECLARCSGLYACLAGNPMYGFHRARRDPLYSDYAVYSPDVPVFRSEDPAGTLLDEPWSCSFITCPAVNANALMRDAPGRAAEVVPAMRARVDKVLTLATAHGHTEMVLGAWGCGAFGNDGHRIAALFREALDGRFAGVFEQVAFAITDWSPERRFIGPFEGVFGGSRAGAP